MVIGMSDSDQGDQGRAPLRRLKSDAEKKREEVDGWIQGPGSVFFALMAVAMVGYLIYAHL